jgi:catechol 2,3-dioxygenase-like lactoylglutathione lyase family enzyme
VVKNLRVFDHLTIRVSDLAASRAFYVEALGLPTHDGELVEWGDFSIVADGPATRRLHAGFGVDDRDAVDAWWNRMTEAGYESDGEPGPRPQYSESYYGAFVLDPDGNSIEAVHHAHVRPRELDHVWFRTRDLDAVRAFFRAIAPTVGLTFRSETGERVTLSDGAGSFSFVPGEQPTERVHYAFGVPDRSAVDAFHAAALAAGYRDNGGPGERPQYHPGYYGAFVLDPDGHNAEAVFHERPS